MREPEVERLPATHRKPRQRTVFTVRLHGVVGLDEGNDVHEEIVLERRSPTPETRTQSAAPAGPAGIGRGVAVGEDEDHGLDFFVGDKVVENDIRHSLPGPFFLLVAADAVEQIQHGILLVFGIASRGVDLHPTLDSDGLGIVIHPLKFAVFDALSRLVESIWRVGEGGLVVGAQGDGAAKAATTTTPALAAVAGGGGLGGGRLAFRCCLRTSEVARLARELDFIARNLACEGDTNVVSLGAQQLDKRHRVTINLSLLELGVAFLVGHFHAGLARHVRAVLFEVERVFLQTALRVEFGFPGAVDIGGGNGAGEGREGQH